MSSYVRRPVQTAVGMLILMGLVGTLHWLGFLWPAPGPLAPPPGRVGSGGLFDVGERFSYGLLFLSNRGPEPAVILRVTLARVTPGLELIGMYSVPAESDHPLAHVGLVRAYPPDGESRKGQEWPGPTRPVPGAVVPPGKSQEVVMGFRMTRPGVGGFRGIVVDYRVGWRRFRAYFDDSVVACVPPSSFTLDTCPSFLP
jgi:hypothetical protein